YFFLSKISSASYNEDQPTNNIVASQPLIAKAAKGKTIFQNKCATCHNVFTQINAPSLAGFETRGPWADRNKLYAWIRNTDNFMKTDLYTQSLRQKFGYLMKPSSELSDEEIDLIVE